LSIKVRRKTIMNRICPSEEILSEYISGILSPEDRIGVEKHLASCDKCRKLVAETHDIINKCSINEIKNALLCWIGKNRWLLGASVTFVCSFLFPKYFLQFLTACLLLGAKWIIDAKNTKMLIMIYEAWKRSDKDKAGEILSRFDSKK
jgi:hypothetical protein